MEGRGVTCVWMDTLDTQTVNLVSVLQKEFPPRTGFVTRQRENVPARTILEAENVMIVLLETMTIPTVSVSFDKNI